MEPTINPFQPTDLPLPSEMHTALNAIETPEVQEIMKALSKYNLGVCIPHRHNEETGDFEMLSESQIQLEDDLTVSFIGVEEATKIKGIPVAWRWNENGVASSAICVGGCTASSSQTHGDRHIKYHNKH